MPHSRCHEKTISFLEEAKAHGSINAYIGIIMETTTKDDKISDLKVKICYDLTEKIELN